MWTAPDGVSVLAETQRLLKLDELVAVVPDVGHVQLRVVGRHTVQETRLVHPDVGRVSRG